MFEILEEIEVGALKKGMIEIKELKILDEKKFGGFYFIHHTKPKFKEGFNTKSPKLDFQCI